MIYADTYLDTSTEHQLVGISKCVKSFFRDESMARATSPCMGQHIHRKAVKASKAAILQHIRLILLPMVLADQSNVKLRKDLESCSQNEKSHFALSNDSHRIRM
ncbi:hypothetical protein TNCV_799571 [Trichonephila clavipes]|nr:hypothetical protein TNCV_799571 [Trichonephila clavipes]